ncbi:MAG: glycosyltransferase [Nitrospirae bacterium]|nr:glycosyltransferase [Nitrospirota bacterium]MBF0540033.1 glycosyltransferase [Nitrospirota bacterium]
MNNTPLVSVLLTVYNNARDVSKSIESILNQTLTDFEFVIINDGSTDNTQGVLEGYAKRDSRIKIFKQENIGLTKSLNKGLGLVKGKYLARQDADDLSNPDRLLVQLKTMEENGLDFVGSNVDFITETDEFISRSNLPLMHEDIKKAMTITNSIIHTSLFIKTDVIKVIKYDEELIMAQDYDLYLRLIEGGYKCQNIERPLASYRVKVVHRVKNYDERNRSSRYSLMALKKAKARGILKISSLQIIKRQVLLQIPVPIKQVFNLIKSKINIAI